jgi:hypothetical protein
METKRKQRMNATDPVFKKDKQDWWTFSQINQKIEREDPN